MNFEDQNTVSAETVDRLAKACCLTLREEERQSYAVEIERMLSFLSCMENPAECQADWQEEAVPLCMLRDDRTQPCLPRDGLLSMAAEQNGACFLVPLTVTEQDGTLK